MHRGINKLLKNKKVSEKMKDISINNQTTKHKQKYKQINTNKKITNKLNSQVNKNNKINKQNKHGSFS